MKENIKLGLLGIIAIGVVYLSFFKTAPETVTKSKENTAQAPPPNQPAANPNAIKDPPPPSVPVGEATYIKFEKQEYDFGKTKVGQKNRYVFKFKNTGDRPLIITSAKPGCSCTVPEIPEAPIAPGETGEIPVEFTAKESQRGSDVNQMVTVTANTNPPQTQLKITAKVEK